jgi:alpha-L-fucosidase
VKAVTLLADGKAVPFKQESDGLHLTLPAKPVGQYAYALRIDLAGQGGK